MKKGAVEGVEGGGAAAAAAAVQVEKASFWSSSSNKRQRKGSPEEGLLSSEPTSVLDHRRSPSPPTSSSTLSSSPLAGGPASSDGVAAVAGAPAAEDGRREDWAAELAPIPAGLSGGDKHGLAGAEDWEALLSEPPAAAGGGGGGQDQSFLRWIMGDIDDPSASAAVASFKQLDGNLGFGLADSGFGFEPIGGIGGGSSAMPASSAAAPPPPAPLVSSVAPASGFVPMGKIPSFGNQPTSPIFPSSAGDGLSLPPTLLYGESMEEKPLLSGPSLILNQNQQAESPANPVFFLPLPQFGTQHENPPTPALLPRLLATHPKRHLPVSAEPSCQISPKSSFPESAAASDLFLRRNQPQLFPPLNAAPFQLHQRSMRPKVAGDEATAAMAQQQQQLLQQQALVDQLFKAAELVETGNSVSALRILARLNHQLPSPAGKPLLRSAFYFKEALHLLTSNAPNPPPPSPPSPLSSPVDVVLKLGAYKAFSDVSPVLQFTNFTTVQAFLEALAGATRIHIIDFDIGIGGQWSALMQELAHRRCAASAAAASPLLKITAFASPFSHHPLELHLTRENLSHFASELGIPFEFNVLSLDPFNPALLLGLSGGADEAVAVNLPVGAAIHPPVASLLRLVKQLSPKIVVSVDHGCDRSDLSFAYHFFYAFQSCTVLLDSIDAAGADPDAASKIERFLVQPRMESSVLGRHRVVEKMLPWRTVFASAGFVPVQFSNYTETQAECLLKRVQVRGFNVEKRQASLFLCWQRGELVSVSAWRC